MHTPSISTVAPNGARKTRADHPALPITMGEVANCAAACQAAGADGIHAHLRDASGAHLLDAGGYRELLAELALRAPGLSVQITTESVGRYTPADQRALVRALMSPAVSIALREISADNEVTEAARLFADCDTAGVAVQHILCSADKVDQLTRLVADGSIARDNDARVAEVAATLSALSSDNAPPGPAAAAVPRPDAAQG